MVLGCVIARRLCRRSRKIQSPQKASVFAAGTFGFFTSEHHALAAAEELIFLPRIRISSRGLRRKDDTTGFESISSLRYALYVEYYCCTNG